MAGGGSPLLWIVRGTHAAGGQMGLQSALVREAKAAASPGKHVAACRFFLRSLPGHPQGSPTSGFCFLSRKLVFVAVLLYLGAKTERFVSHVYTTGKLFAQAGGSQRPWRLRFCRAEYFGFISIFFNNAVVINFIMEVF